MVQTWRILYVIEILLCLFVMELIDDVVSASHLTPPPSRFEAAFQGQSDNCINLNRESFMEIPSMGYITSSLFV